MAPASTMEDLFWSLRTQSVPSSGCIQREGERDVDLYQFDSQGFFLATQPHLPVDADIF